MNNLILDYGLILKEYTRIKLRLKPDDISKILGKSNQTVYHLFKTKFPRVDVLFEFLSVLDIRFYEIFKNDEQLMKLITPRETISNHTKEQKIRYRSSADQWEQKEKFYQSTIDHYKSKVSDKEIQCKLLQGQVDLLKEQIEMLNHAR